MAGRIGNTVTVNGRMPGPVTVRRGERLRLRLVNAANARIFGLTFQGHRPRVIALDGQPIEPHEPAGGRIVLGPAMRADLILDMPGVSGERFAVTDTFYPRLAYTLLDLVYSPEAPLRNRPSEALRGLPANTLPEPDLTSAVRHRVTFTGGMMGMMGMMNGSGMMGGMMGRGMMGGMMHGGPMWTINGVTATGHVMEPLLTLERHRTYVLSMANDTAWYHPIHLHGHAFRVLTRNGQPTPYREWQDTVLLAPRERVEIAFVADNPGNWMFHCHILEHQDAGMMGVVRVV